MFEFLINRTRPSIPSTYIFLAFAYSSVRSAVPPLYLTTSPNRLSYVHPFLQLPALLIRIFFVDDSVFYLPICIFCRCFIIGFVSLTVPILKRGWGHARYVDEPYTYGVFSEGICVQRTLEHRYKSRIDYRWLNAKCVESEFDVSACRTRWPLKRCYSSHRSLTTLESVIFLKCGGLYL